MCVLFRSTRLTSRSGLLFLSVLTTFFATPAFAETAVIRGAMSRISPSGFVTSVAGEVVAPAGMYFNQPLTVGGQILTGNGAPPINTAALLAQLTTLQGQFNATQQAITSLNASLQFDNNLLNQAIALRDAQVAAGDPFNLVPTLNGQIATLQTQIANNTASLSQQNATSQQLSQQIAAIQQQLNAPPQPGSFAATGANLSLNAGAPVPVLPLTPGTTLKQAVATELDSLNPNTVDGLDAYAAILKAAVGADGLE